MKTLLILFLIFGYLHSLTLKVETEPPTFLVKFITHPNRRCEIIYDGETQIHTEVNNEQTRLNKKSAPVFVKRFPQILEHEKEPDLQNEVVEVFGIDRENVWKKVKSMCKETFPETLKYEIDQSKDEVYRLSYSGRPDNRIDIVFMGDGYTEAQKDLHLEDMKRLHQEMFEGVTFRSFLPLFNVWAVFRPSKESGIGKGSPKNTAYKLYREGITLRAIYPGDPSAARSACRATGPNACDFPTLIGNDPYYGGLGGEFAISTSSKTSGTVVLRHEFGHNFGNVGEEYDSGWHSGANAATSIAEVNGKWGKWLTGPAVPQDSAMRINEYPWYDLGKGPKVFRFTSTGTYPRWLLRFSVSGAETQDAIAVLLDGKELPWKTHGNLDRGFHEIANWEYNLPPLSAGTHELRFEQRTRPTREIRMLGNLFLQEYADESRFKFGPENVNAYYCFSGTSKGAFRPQNELCLMRNMTSEKFCVIDQENLWVQFLRRMSLIDNVSMKEVNSTHIHVAAELVKVGQLREGPKIPGEKYSIWWYKGGSEVVDLRDKFEFVRSKSESIGNWQLKVSFSTEEVRIKTFDYTKSFQIKQ